MLSTTFASYALMAVFGLVALTKIIADRRLAFVTILLNLMFGGALYVILNICNISLPFNAISASCITLLGAPGVILLLILRFIFGTF